MPDTVYHFAAQSFPHSFDTPVQTLTTNVIGNDKFDGGD